MTALRIDDTVIYNGREATVKALMPTSKPDRAVVRYADGREDHAPLSLCERVIDSSYSGDVDGSTGEITPDDGYSEIVVEATFNYAALDATTRTAVQQRTSEIKTLMRRSAQDIIEIGKKLTEVKASLGHGRFGEWLRLEFGWAERTAQNFMAVYERFKSANFADLAIAPSALYLLATSTTPDDVVTQIIEQAQSGVSITHSMVKGAIAVAHALVHSNEDERVDALAAAIQDAPAAVQQVVVANGIADAELVPRLTHAFTNKLETWDDITRSGTLDGERPIARVSPTEFDEYLDRKAFEHRAASVEAQKQSAIFSSKSVEWYTPSEYLEAAREVMGAIELDPASCEQANEAVGAQRFYGANDDGLQQEWFGRVWLNPPYGVESGESVAGKWVARLVAAYENREIDAAILLVNAVTDRKWFQPLWKYPICFTDHRIEFNTPTGTPDGPLTGNVFVYFGEDVASFVREFSPYGAVVRRINA